MSGDEGLDSIQGIPGPSQIHKLDLESLIEEVISRTAPNTSKEREYTELRQSYSFHKEASSPGHVNTTIPRKRRLLIRAAEVRAIVKIRMIDLQVTLKIDLKVMMVKVMYTLTFHRLF